jgi:hypothetical protein
LKIDPGLYDTASDKWVRNVSPPKKVNASAQKTYEMFTNFLSVRKLIYVVGANGAVVAGNRSRWFGRRGQSEIRPGDTIVVPLGTDRTRPLTFLGNVTQILYQGAIAVAAVRTFDN